MTNKEIDDTLEENTKEVNVILYRKISDEQEEFKEKLRSAYIDEVMLYAYELVIREDILLYLEENDLTYEQAEVLLQMDHPLSDLYLKWENCESSHMSEIGNVIECYANELLRSKQ